MEVPAMMKQLDICRKCPKFKTKVGSQQSWVSCDIDETLTRNGLSVGARLNTARQYVRTDIPGQCACKLEYLVLNGCAGT